jgi:DNA-binding CsgD family transcriptional regulator/predicted ATPase
VLAGLWVGGMVGTGAVPRLVGRETEINAVLSLVRADAPLITVTGAPGVGKSVLVAEVVRRLAAEDGAVPCLVDLAMPAMTPTRAAAAVARAARQREDEEPRLAAVVAERAETCLDRAHDVVARIAPWPGAVVLVPSVIPLEVPGERTFLLRPLGCEPPDPERADAVHLFMDTVRDSAAELPFDPGRFETVSRICASVDGLPSAIQRAAELCSHLPWEVVEQLLSDGDRALTMLSERGRAPIVARGPAAALDQVHALLPPSSRQLLTALSAFSGPFTADEAAQVAGMRTDSVVGTLAALTGAGLLLAGTERGRAGGSVFRLPRLVRAYGRRRLEDADLDANCGFRERHVYWVTGLVTALADREGGDKTRAAVPDSLAPDVREALSWSKDHAPRAALSLATALVPLVLRHGDEWELCRRLPEWVDSCLAGDPDRVDALTLLESARLAFKSGGTTGTARPLAHLEEGLRRARAGDRPVLVLHGLAIWIDAVHVTGDLPTAARAIEDGLRLSRELDDQAWLARYEAWQGMVLHVSGDVEGAVELGVRSLERARRHKDPRGILAAGMLLHPMERRTVSIPGGPPTMEELYELSEQLGEQRLRLIVMAMLARRALRAGSEAVGTTWLLRRTQEVVRQERWHDLGFSLMLGALVAADRRDDARAARWHGALTPTLDSLLVITPPGEAVSYRRTIARVATRFGEEPFDAAVRAGAGADWRRLAEEIIKFACELADGPSAREDALGSLTDRERQVLAVIAQGLSNKAAAEQLGISPKTVMHHTVAIYRKLGVGSRGEAAAWARARGLH